MKSKLFKILGVIAAVAMIAAAIVAPVSATVSAVTVTVAAHPATDGDISTVGKYSIYATLGTQLLGSNSSITMPYTGDVVRYTDAAGTGKITVTISSGAIGVVMSGAGTWTPGTGVIQFATAGETATITATGSTVISTVQNIGASTFSIITDKSSPAPTLVAGAYSLPAVGDSFTITANTDLTATLPAATFGTYAVTFPSGTGSYAVPTITFGTSTSAVVTATAVSTTGTWTAISTATAALTTNVYPTAISAAANGGNITVTFPAGFTVAAPTATLAAGTGWVTLPGAATPSSVGAALTVTPTWSFNATNLTVTATLPAGDYIGANAQVLIYISGGVTNPSTAGSYTLTVATSAENTAVTSAAFAITNPAVAAVSGVASVYNTAATPVLINQYNSLNTAIGTAVGIAGGATIKLTAGTYADTTGTYGVAGTSGSVITIQGTDASAANVIIQGLAAWTLQGATIVVDSVTIDGKNGTFTISGAKSGTLSNSIINNKNAVIMSAVGTGTSNVTKDTFTVATGKTGLAMTAPVTVTGSTFTVTGTGNGIAATSDVTVSGSTFTGAANTTDVYLGNGINFTAASTGTGTSIGTSTFTGLSNALIVNNAGAIVSFTGNTVTNCGQAAPPAAAATPAITLTAATGLNLYGNTITAGTSNILTVASGYAPVVNCTQNTFTGNAKSVSSADKTATTGIVNMARNWWGAAANVPANVTLVAGTTAGLQFTPALGGAPGTAAFVSLTASATNPIAASATVGVNVTASTGAGIIGATALAANPVAVAVPSPYTAVKFWDVYGTIATATIDFYGTTAAPVTAANSALLWYNSVNGTWTNTNATANAFANYMEIMVGPTGNITAAQFGGTPFVLVTFPTTLGAPTPAAGTIFPVNGATGVPVSGVTFTWPIVTPPAGSTVTYQFALAQASANTSANEFAILDYSDNSITNAEPNQETLQYNTVYWWEVRAVVMSSTGAISLTGPWTISMFTTGSQPTTTAVVPTTVVSSVTTVVTTNVNVTSPVTTITFTQPTSTSTPAIPAYLLWAVIAVGAILVIAVIVLIVRTRRIP